MSSRKIVSNGEIYAILPLIINLNHLNVLSFNFKKEILAILFLLIFYILFMLAQKSNLSN